MNDKLLQYLIDPAKSKILLEVNRAGRITVRELCAKCSDIPRSSMYRHLTRLERDGFLEVVEYKRVRGTVEKTYALQPGAFPSEGDAPPAGMTQDFLVAMFTAYCVEYIKKFQDYAEANQGVDAPKDVMGFYTAPVYATDAETVKAMEDIGKILTSMASNDCTDGRRARSIGLIVSPPREAEDDQD